MNMTLQEIIDGSRRIVFFGGAGVSTESGIPDFRSVDGLYHQQYELPAGGNPEPQLFHDAAGGVLSLLSGEDAAAGRGAQCGAPEASGIGTGRGC